MFPNGGSGRNGRSVAQRLDSPIRTEETEPLVTRRRMVTALVVGGVAGATGLTSGCARSTPTRRASVIDFLGDDATGRSPLWAPDPGAYVVEIPDGGELVPEAAGSLLVVSARCSNDGRKVGWCVAAERFVCPTCRSTFDSVGTVESGPARRGLDRYSARETAGGALQINDAVRAPGAARSASIPRVTPDAVLATCQRLRFGTSSGKTV